MAFHPDRHLDGALISVRRDGSGRHGPGTVASVPRPGPKQPLAGHRPVDEVAGRRPAAGLGSRGAGRGYASLAIADNRIYTLGDAPSTAEDKDEYVVCFDQADGKPLWKTKTGPAWTSGAPDWQSSRSTPTVDGERLYVADAPRQAVVPGKCHRPGGLAEGHGQGSRRQEGRRLGVQRVGADRRRPAGVHAGRRQSHDGGAEQADRRADLESRSGRKIAVPATPRL